jgi:hypothetical protein
MSANKTNANYRSLIKKPYEWSYTGDIDIVNYTDVNSSNFSYWIGYDSDFSSNDKINVLTPGGTFSTSISTGLYFTDRFRSLIVDSSDNIYVSGNDIATSQKLIKKYNSSGVLQWTATYSIETSLLYFPCIAVNSVGEVFAGSSRVTGVNGTFSVKKFNSSGVLQSSFEPGSPFGVQGISCDNNYVYTANGTVIRRTNFNFGSASTFTVGTAPENIQTVIPNNTGDMYAHINTPTPSIRKINSTGTTLWTTNIGGSSAQAWRNMELDKANNRVFVVRVDNSSVTSSNIYTINASGTITASFSTSPVPQWYGFNALRYKNNELYVSAGNQCRKYTV